MLESAVAVSCQQEHLDALRFALSWCLDCIGGSL